MLPQCAGLYSRSARGCAPSERRESLPQAVGNRSLKANGVVPLGRRETPPQGEGYSQARAKGIRRHGRKVFAGTGERYSQARAKGIRRHGRKAFAHGGNALVSGRLGRPAIFSLTSGTQFGIIFVIMGVTTSQQLTRYYDQFRDTEIAFSKEIVRIIHLDPRQVYIKANGSQWPCTSTPRRSRWHVFW